VNKKQRNRQEKWDRRFLSLCRHISEWSKDPSTKVGAIITDGIKVISLGFNGLPQQIPDYPELLNSREVKYKHIIHAETNAILTAHRNLSGCTIYTFPFLPCTRCASEIVQSGISRVVSIVCQEERWKAELAESRHFMKLCGMDVAEYTTL
jgi:dCMP deaminase